VYYEPVTKPFQLELDRSANTPLAVQIRKGIGVAIESGVLAPGARLPSWQDLAAQLGVARGTVRAAYEKLSAAHLIVASRATGMPRASWRPIADSESSGAAHKIWSLAERLQSRHQPG
jgi:GntR family transcriptional regulator/MocR family aminotransferase